MNHRERFLATMHYQPRDRCPLFDFSFWDETIPQWHKEGLPETVTRKVAAQYFGLDYSLGGGKSPPHAPCRSHLCPPHEFKVLEDRGDYEIVQQHDGVKVMRPKHHASIPQELDHLLKDRESWEKHFKPRLVADDPKRFGDGYDEEVARVAERAADEPVFIFAGSMFGWLRDWMGVENISMLVYDDPALFGEMVETLGDIIVENFRRLHEAGVRIDVLQGWEDMCYNAGPLLSPQHVKEYLVPQYKRIWEWGQKLGATVYYTDCDGDPSALVPLWMEAGMNTLFPLEIGDWSDPLEYRKAYGKDLRIMGGFDKHILAKTKADIDREIDRLTPMVEEGGFIPFCDHRVPPNVPFENYVYYCDRVREVWGLGVDLPEKGVVPVGAG